MNLPVKNLDQLRADSPAAPVSRSLFPHRIDGVDHAGTGAELAAFIGSGTIYAPLVNGDLPGPTPVATEDGQFLMVRVS